METKERAESESGPLAGFEPSELSDQYAEAVRFAVVYIHEIGVSDDGHPSAANRAAGDHATANNDAGAAAG